MKFRPTRVAVVVIALSAAVAGCGKYSISNIRSLKAFQDANNLYKKAEYKAAIERYEASIKFNPDLGFAYFFLGNSYDNLYKPARKGEPENDANLAKAAEHYRTAIQKLSASTDPKELEIRKLTYEYLIAAYGPDKLNDFDKAEPVAKELIAAEPNEPSNYQLLGRLYEDQGRYDEAETHFKKAVDLRPKDGLGYQLLAGFYNRQGNFEKTMEAWYARAGAEPNNPEAWHTIGGFYQDKVFRDKRLSKAQGLELTLKGIEAEDKALKLNPDYFEAVSFKNILLRQQALYVDPVKAKALIAEADVLRDRAIELQKKLGTTTTGTKK
jgi:tetratricopeptide (TPR) repeat protein